MTITISTKPEEIKAARTEVLKTEHHSYTGRAEFIAQLAADFISSGKLNSEIDYSKLSDKQRKETGASAIVLPLVKARYPWHASPVHVMKGFWSAVIRLYKKAHAAAAAPATETKIKSESKSSKGKSKSTAKSKRAKRSKSKVEADKLTVAA